MTETQIEQLKYPIGPFVKPNTLTQELVDHYIQDITEFPNHLKNATQGLSSAQKSLKYRPGSWNVKQIAHHCADSHMNAYLRFKNTVTEENPIIMAYDENKWAKLEDANDDDLTSTLALVTGLHSKWAAFLKTLRISDYDREYMHPEYGRTFPISEALPLYSWHCKHHVAQIQQAVRLNGAFPS